jgi:hypothetical protein
MTHRKQIHRKTWYFAVRKGNGALKPGNLIRTSDLTRLDHLRSIAQEISRREYKRQKYGAREQP